MSVLKRAMSDLLGRAATVSELERLSPNLVRIQFTGPQLKGMAFRAGQKVKLRLGEVLRSYTPAGVDAQAGTMDVVFHLHGNGPASQWAHAARPGDQTVVVGPSNSLAGRSGPVRWAWFFGDETTLGVACALLGELEPGTQVGGGIETDPADVEAVAALGLSLTALPRRGDHGAVLLDHASAMNMPDGPGVIWVSGNALAVVAVRKLFLDRGVSRDVLKVKPYWSERGHAHRKQLEKGALRA